MGRYKFSRGFLRFSLILYLVIPDKLQNELFSLARLRSLWFGAKLGTELPSMASMTPSLERCGIVTIWHWGSLGCVT